MLMSALVASDRICVVFHHHQQPEKSRRLLTRGGFVIFRVSAPVIRFEAELDLQLRDGHRGPFCVVAPRRARKEATPVAQANSPAQLGELGSVRSPCTLR